MDSTGVFFLVLAVVGIGIGVFAIVRRQRYVRSLRERGWTFDGSPAFEAVARLENPPFGLGFSRSPDDKIGGLTKSGRAFQVIEYGAENWKGWVGMVTLSRRLPELWIMAGQARPRYGVDAAKVAAPAQLGPGWQIGALDPTYAEEVLTPALCERLQAMAAVHPDLNLGIDGDQLAVLDPPRKDAEVLAPWLEQLATVAEAIDTAALDRWIRPPEQPSRMSFYHHPDWQFVGEDDSLLQTTPAKQSGYDHNTKDVIRGRDGDGPPFVAFEHEWKTSRTESYTDSEGRSQTRTVVENHRETILGFQLPTRMPALKVGLRGFGSGISFESGAFNEQFAVQPTTRSTHMT